MEAVCPIKMKTNKGVARVERGLLYGNMSSARDSNLLLDPTPRPDKNKKPSVFDRKEQRKERQTIQHIGTKAKAFASLARVKITKQNSDTSSNSNSNSNTEEDDHADALDAPIPAFDDKRKKLQRKTVATSTIHEGVERDVHCGNSGNTARCVLPGDAGDDSLFLEPPVSDKKKTKKTGGRIRGKKKKWGSLTSPSSESNESESSPALRKVTSSSTSSTKGRRSSFTPPASNDVGAATRSRLPNRNSNRLVNSQHSDSMTDSQEDPTKRSFSESDKISIHSGDLADIIDGGGAPIDNIVFDDNLFSEIPEDDNDDDDHHHRYGGGGPENTPQDQPPYRRSMAQQRTSTAEVSFSNLQGEIQMAMNASLTGITCDPSLLFEDTCEDTFEEALASISETKPNHRPPPTRSNACPPTSRGLQKGAAESFSNLGNELEMAMRASLDDARCQRFNLTDGGPPCGPPKNIGGGYNNNNSQAIEYEKKASWGQLDEAMEAGLQASMVNLNVEWNN